VDERLGAPVRRADSQAGGFTHGVAARLTLADGRRAFVKAIRSDDGLAADYRAEASAVLPRDLPVPTLLFHLEAYGWIVLAFTDVEGRHPDVTRRSELSRVLAAAETLATRLTPSPLPAPPAEVALAPVMSGWRRFAETGPPDDLDHRAARHLDRLAELEAGWAEAVAGVTLLHGDLRPDNMILTGTGTVMVVDWAGACVGAAWVDLLILLGSVTGVDGEPIVRSHPLTRSVEPDRIDAFLCALTGLWAEQSRGPLVPTSPRLRAFQSRNATATLEWLMRRLGW
jgi:aminoglycoside phosphotransferase (APT) family kinase protein